MSTAVDEDVIVARASPAGRGAIALIRLSGARALDLVKQLCPDGPAFRPRRAALRQAMDADGHALDDLLCIWMPGPRSYTGEDVVELSCHGNPAIVDALIDRCVVLGARPAGPGEFTRRALLAGRLDLVEAEAVDGLIRARGLAGVQAARAGLDGRLQGKLDVARERLLDFGAELEARLDHPGEDLGEVSDATLIAQLRDFGAELATLASTWTQTRRRIEGAVVALVGSVNAGKSSLFNHLVGARRALVSDQPGTTRDAVERTVDWDGLQVTFVDTAGRRSTSGEIEAAGIALGEALAEAADLRLWVFDGREPPPVMALADPTWRVATHTDCGVVQTTADFRVSNTAGTGLAALRAALSGWLGAVDPAGSALVGSQRQHDLLLRVVHHVDQAADAMAGGIGPVVAAEEVVCALERLGSIAGQNVREDVLDRLFSRFCVGK